MKIADDPEPWKPKTKEKSEKKLPRTQTEETSEAEDSVWKTRSLPLACADCTVNNGERENPPGQSLIHPITDTPNTEQNKKEFTSVSEIRQIESLLKLLELKLYDFHQILLRLDRRRGLVNFGGSLFKTLSGTATIAGGQQLHDTLTFIPLTWRIR